VLHMPTNLFFLIIIYIYQNTKLPLNHPHCNKKKKHDKCTNTPKSQLHKILILYEIKSFYFVKLKRNDEIVS
jgi:hypothetical protein